MPCVMCMNRISRRAQPGAKDRKQPAAPCKALKYNDSTSLLFALVWGCLVSLGEIWPHASLIWACEALAFLVFCMTVNSAAKAASHLAANPDVHRRR